MCSIAQSTEVWLYFILAAAGGPRYDIVEELGVLSESAKGWTKERNLISWNGGVPKVNGI